MVVALRCQIRLEGIPSGCVLYKKEANTVLVILVLVVNARNNRLSWSAGCHNYQPRQMITLNDPFTVEGIVIESSIDSPYESFLHPIPEYRIVLDLDDPSLIDDLGLVFDERSSEHINTWKIDRGTLRASSVIKPSLSKDGRRCTGELIPGESVLLRCKAVLNELPNGDVSALQILYVVLTEEAVGYAEDTSVAEEKYGNLDF